MNLAGLLLQNESVVGVNIRVSIALRRLRTDAAPTCKLWVCNNSCNMVALSNHDAGHVVIVDTWQATPVELQVLNVAKLL